MDDSLKDPKIAGLPKFDIASFGVATMKTKIKNVVICVCLTLLVGSGLADEKVGDEAHVYSMQTFKISWSDIDSYLEYYDKEWMPLVKQNEFSLGHNIYQHAWGPDWTLLIVEEFESMTGLAKAHEKYDELWRAKYPDAIDRNAADKGFDKYIHGHFDAIVTEMPGYSK